jgi:hypothetical protein
VDDRGSVAVGHWAGSGLDVGDDVRQTILAGLGEMNPVSYPGGGELPGILAIRIEQGS